MCPRNKKPTLHTQNWKFSTVRILSIKHNRDARPNCFVCHSSRQNSGIHLRMSVAKQTKTNKQKDWTERASFYFWCRTFKSTHNQKWDEKTPQNAPVFFCFCSHRTTARALYNLFTRITAKPEGIVLCITRSWWLEKTNPPHLPKTWDGPKIVLNPMFSARQLANQLATCVISFLKSIAAHCKCRQNGNLCQFNFVFNFLRGLSIEKISKQLMHQTI